jgi:hypothetical protein
MSEDLIVLREILQRELETINAYEKMLDRVSDPILREIIDHVTDEEREHVTEMYELILKRDPKQAGRAELGQKQIETMLHVAGPGSGHGHGPGSAPMAEVQTAATAAGLASPLVSGRGSAAGSAAGPGSGPGSGAGGDPNPPPPPIFPDGAWSVGSLKRDR